MIRSTAYNTNSWYILPKFLEVPPHLRFERLSNHWPIERAVARSFAVTGVAGWWDGMGSAVNDNAAGFLREVA
jgi:hypothetical protein